MSKVVVIHGPPASGKTRYAKELARHYGVTKIVDGWDPGHPKTPDALHLSLVPVRGSIAIHDALRAAGITGAVS